jgi:type II secretory pathway pseudopilin PulG
MSRRSRTPRSRRGFTLVEAILSASIFGVLSLGMVSAIAIVAKAAPRADAAGRARTSANTALNELSAELRYMTSIRSIGETFIEFTVSDRNGDGGDELIRYNWAGAGQPLVRTYNGVAATAIPVVHAFSLGTTTTKSTVTETTTGSVSSGEIRLARWNGWPLVLTPTITQTALTGTAWSTSYFKLDEVSLPPNLTRLELTKLRVAVKKSASATGTTVSAGIYTSAVAGGPRPSTTQIGSTSSLALTSIPTTFTGLIDFPLTGVTFSSAPTELNFVLKGSGTAAALVQYYSSILATGDTPVYLTCTDSGGSWTPTKNLQQNDIPFEVWGSYEYPASIQQSTDLYYLNRVNIALSTSSSPADRFTASIRTLNTPQAPSP